MNNFLEIKLCFAPISKNFVDALIEYSNENNIKFIFIPSRRQIDYDGGYVNNWTTESFSDYVRSKTNNIYLERDHGGPSQGKVNDDGLISFKEDIKYFDIIHIDPWKFADSYDDGICLTKKLIEYCYNLNNKIYYEISTEEAIKKLDINILEKLINYLKSELKPEIYEKIIYLVIQSGTALKDGKNIGNFEDNRLKEMINLSKKYGFLSKEHNGDWISENEFKLKFMNGLNSLNIAPEVGTFETNIYLEEIERNNDLELFNYFYNLCYESDKWKKWVSEDFSPEKNKKKLIEICGHYVFSDEKFNKIKNKFKDIDKIIISQIKNKINKYISDLNYD